MDTKIHFLNTGHSDCIILESCGKFAMIDSAEDTDFPADKPHLALPGYEDVVVEYLLKHCKNHNNRVTLEFVLGTHAHSDHIGGFDTVINHPEIDVKKAFLKPYYPQSIFIMEQKRWDNEEVYGQMIDAINKNNVELIQTFDNYSFSFGECKITFLNGKWKKRKFKFGENINSVVTLIECKNKKILLAGDLNYKDGDEKAIAKIIGKVDMLKVGHHGYFGSTSLYWAKTLSPEYAIVTNKMSNIYPDVRFKLKNIAKAKIFATVDSDGIIAKIDDNSNLSIITNCMGKKYEKV
ncbi:MAG: hypothetical protein LIO62_02345 [Clostridiales bacterium]|nr:hypothetical protein [Clostridiales bacterium]